MIFDRIEHAITRGLSELHGCGMGLGFDLLRNAESAAFRGIGMGMGIGERLCSSLEFNNPFLGLDRFQPRGLEGFMRYGLGNLLMGMEQAAMGLGRNALMFERMFVGSLLRAFEHHMHRPGMFQGTQAYDPMSEYGQMPEYGQAPEYGSMGGYGSRQGYYSPQQEYRGGYGYDGDQYSNMSARPLGPGEQVQARQLYNYFLGHGFSPMQAAGILGNMQTESSFNTGAFNPNEGAIGLCQWEGNRRTNLENFAAQSGRPVTDWRVQADFVMHELSGSEGAAGNSLRSCGSPEQAAHAFQSQYERSACLGDRAANASNIYQQMAC